MIQFLVEPTLQNKGLVKEGHGPDLHHTEGRRLPGPHNQTVDDTGMLLTPLMSGMISSFCDNQVN